MTVWQGERAADHGWMEENRHYWRERIYYDLTDAAGITYHANYLKLADHARSEWLYLLGVDHDSVFVAQGLFIAMRHCEIDWLSPARAGDLVTVESVPVSLSRASCVLRQCVQGADGMLLCRMTLRMVCVNEAMQPSRLPDRFTAAIQSHLPDSDTAEGSTKT